MIALADHLLGRDGRLLAAHEAMGAAQPLDSGPLVRLPQTVFPSLVNRLSPTGF
jgi:hypothetical protein